MFKKTLILRRKGRIRLILTLYVVLLALAMSPALIGVGLMSLQEIATGTPQHEGNNVLGVLPWFTIFTMAIFGPGLTLLFNLTLLGIVYDIITLIWQALSKRKEPEEIDPPYG
jgi:hypothetical protein